MKCNDIQDLLSPYLDGVLTSVENELISEHLKSCDACRQELEDLKEIINIMQSLDDVPLPEDFQDQIHEKLLSIQDENMEPVVSKTNLRWWQRMTNSKWFSYGVAAVVLLTVISIFNPLNFLQPQSDMLQMKNSMSEAEFSAAEEFDMPREQKSLEANYGVMEDVAAPQVASKRASLSENSSVERKIIKTANLVVEVDDLQSAFNKITDLANKGGGYVLNSSTYCTDSSNVLNGNITIKVSKEYFQQTLVQIESLGDIKNKGLSGQDVTAEFYDTQARLKQFYKQEERFLELIDKAKNIDEVLRVERELNRVRSEIEVMEGRIKYLSQMTDMATIDISLMEKNQPSDRISTHGVDGVWQRAIAGFIATTNGLIQKLGEMVVFTGRVLPIILFGSIILIIMYMIWTNFFKNKD